MLIDEFQCPFRDEKIHVLIQNLRINHRSFESGEPVIRVSSYVPATHIHKRVNKRGLKERNTTGLFSNPFSDRPYIITTTHKAFSPMGRSRKWPVPAKSAG